MQRTHVFSAVYLVMCIHQKFNQANTILDTGYVCLIAVVVDEAFVRIKIAHSINCRSLIPEITVT